MILTCTTWIVTFAVAIATNFMLRPFFLLKGDDRYMYMWIYLGKSKIEIFRSAMQKHVVHVPTKFQEPIFINNEDIAFFSLWRHRDCIVCTVEFDSSSIFGRNKMIVSLFFLLYLMSGSSVECQAVLWDETFVIWSGVKQSCRQNKGISYWLLW